MAVKNKSQLALGDRNYEVMESGRGNEVDPSAIAQELRNRAETLYGYGDAPTWRIKFYERMQRSIVRQPKKLAPLAEALMRQAAKCDYPDRFFTKAFMREAERINAWAVE